MFRLIGNENTKIYRRWRTWIMTAILLLAVVLVGVVMANTKHDNANWKQTLQASNSEIQQQMQDSHMPAAAAKQMQQQVEMNQYYIDHNVNPFQTTGWKFAVDAENLATLLIAFVVVIAGDIVASEFSGGTIKMLLTQTATRTSILASKYIAAVWFGVVLTAILFVFSLLVGGILFGFGGAGDPNIYVDPQHNMQHMSMAAFLFMQYGFLLVQLVISVTIAFMVSAIFRSSALAITVSILAYLVGNTLVQALSSFSWVKYILFANTDLSQFVIGGPAIPGLTLGFSITMLIVYFVVMMFLSWLIFVKRDVAYT